MDIICISTPWMKNLRFQVVKELDQGHIAREKLDRIQTQNLIPVALNTSYSAH